MDKRWWEFYALRYALGTVMGVFILLYLFIHTDIATRFGLEKLAFLIPKDPKDLSFTHLVILGVCGLAYCYLSSAPMLVFHALRANVFKSSSHQSSFWIGLVTIVISLVITAFLVYKGYTSSDNLKWWQIFYFFILSTFSSFTAALSILGISNSNFLIVNFYKKLAEKRQRKLDYVESYRHLREHANAFALVLCEIIFCLLFVTGLKISGSVNFVPLLVILWLFGPALIWFVANELESELTK
ncbi:TPA: hypothetical protein ACQWG9_000165 [Neisseria subflava]|jgi:hypothetical protein|uniref:hypothetical protein n=1 Tax=unclassified Neisseria TaxID=2623750 RepID=UPI0035FB0FAA